jgi:hypothetical protein
MVRIEWVEFLQQHPQGAIVHARVRPVRGSTHLRGLRNLLHKLIEAQAPEGSHATCIAREEEETVIRCGFARAEDAEKFARCVGAKAGAPKSVAWHFDLDAAKEVELAGRSKLT